jgi:broad specificity phosphatase PhoE
MIDFDMRFFARHTIALALTLLLVASTSGPIYAQKTIVLVRHAEKVDEPGRDPALTDAGRARAEALADILADMHVTHVISSQFERTKGTAQPTANRAGLTIEVIGAGASQDALQAVVDAVGSRAEGETILIVGHSNTTPRLVHALGGPALEDLQEHEYDSIYVVQQAAAGSDDSGGTKMMRLRYGVPNG